MYKITEKELIDRAQFFCKELLGIKLLIPVEYFHGSDDYFVYLNNRVRGAFISSNEYGSLDNDERCKIIINDNLGHKVYGDVNQLNDTLIHELIHYYLWYLGYESNDNSKDFIEKTKELGISNNYEFRYDIKDDLGYGTKNCDYNKLQQYEEMYQKHKREKKEKNK